MTPPVPRSQREDLARRFIMLQKALWTRFRASLPAAVREGMGSVTSLQMEALRIIAARGALTMGELAAAMGTTSMSAMTQLADRLVKLGFVERQDDDSDRRVVRLTLSEAATEIVGQFIEGHQNAIVEAFEGLDDDEVETLVRLLEKVAGPSADLACARPEVPA